MTKQLLLYSTSNCHLCELAYAMLLKFSDSCAIHISDIADDEPLLMRYGTRIPVLQRLDNKQELDWPFDERALYAFLR